MMGVVQGPFQAVVQAIQGRQREENATTGKPTASPTRVTKPVKSGQIGSDGSERMENRRDSRSGGDRGCDSWVIQW